jgi:hypothetical protein
MLWCAAFVCLFVCVSTCHVIQPYLDKSELDRARFTAEKLAFHAKMGLPPPLPKKPAPSTASGEGEVPSSRETVTRPTTHAMATTPASVGGHDALVLTDTDHPTGPVMLCSPTRADAPATETATVVATQDVNTAAHGDADDDDDEKDHRNETETEGEDESMREDAEEDAGEDAEEGYDE